jgi:hypothetical protein
MSANILTECYIDTLLAEAVVPPAKGYNHQHSCNKVLSTMKTKLANVFAVGIIDDDKLVPKDFEIFQRIQEYNKALALYKHRSKPHYIIKIIPASEQFILNSARQCNISPLDYNLPDELKQFRTITKHKTAKDSPDLKNLLRAIKLNNADNFIKLAEWIEKLKTNPFEFVNRV